MTLSELYKKSVVYPGIVLIAIASLYSIVAYWNHQDYQDGTYAKWELIGMTIVLSIVYWLIICLLSRTIFLSKSEKVSCNSTLSALSWFLLPFGFMLAVFGKAINEFVTSGSVWEILYATIGNIPFVIGLIWGYKKFKKINRT